MGLSIRGARANNLADVDLDLPLGALIVFCGPSGSGKSSLAFDTLFAEGERRYLEAASAGSHRPADLSAPDVDEIRGLPPTLALDQRAPLPGGSRVGEAAGLLAPLRLLFGRAGTPHCPRCGRVIVVTPHDAVVARIARHGDGARLTIEAAVKGGGTVAARVEAATTGGFSRVRVGGEVLRVEDVRPGRFADDREVRVVVDRIRLEPGKLDRVHDAVRTASKAGRGEVVVAVEGAGEERFVDRPYCPHDDLELPKVEPRLFEPRSATGRCPTCSGRGRDGDDHPCAACDGSGLGDAARAVTFDGVALPTVTRRTIGDARALVASWPRTAVSERPLADLAERLGRLDDLGLGHLPLDGDAGRLSGGEGQRVRLARQLGGRLSGVLYVLDEPAAGLPDADAARIVDALRALVAQGNTVVAVEHHPVVVRAADHVVEFGPGAGPLGGRIVYEGPASGLFDADTATGRALSGRERLPSGRATAGPIAVFTAIDVPPVRVEQLDLPTGAIVALTGPSGSGKTLLLDAVTAAVDPNRPRGAPASGVGSVRLPTPFLRVLSADRRAVARSARSNVATFTGLWSVVRELLAATAEAKIRGLDASMFSLNVKGGRCEACAGTGVARVELGWLPDVYLTCDVCEGRRFTSDVLRVRWKGLDAHELLSMSTSDALSRLAGHPDLESKLRAIVDVGLGYLPLGQGGHTWSGGEAQRLLLAKELARAHRRGGDGTLVVLDDPTVGLHPVDVAVLLRLLRQLADDGATVWLATHDDALAAACDARIHLGPGVGAAGGRVVGVS